MEGRADRAVESVGSFMTCESFLMMPRRKSGKLDKCFLRASIIFFRML